VASSWDLSIALRRDVNLTANSTARKLSLIDKGKGALDPTAQQAR
jgi:hypothetical protein